MIHGLSGEKNISHLTNLESAAFAKAIEDGLDVEGKIIIATSDNSMSEFKNKFSLSILRNLRRCIWRYKTPYHGKSIVRALAKRAL